MHHVRNDDEWTLIGMDRRREQKIDVENAIVDDENERTNEEVKISSALMLLNVRSFIDHIVDMGGAAFIIYLLPIEDRCSSSE